MATSYFITNLTNNAPEAASAFLWKLLRPVMLRNNQDTTKNMLSVIRHPLTGIKAIVVDDLDPFYNFKINDFLEMVREGQTINNQPKTLPDIDAIIDTITDELQSTGFITTLEKSALRTFVKNNKGENVNIVNLIPTKFKPPKTKLEMELLGWFPINII